MRIFEINTWTWLTELSERYGRCLTLETVPDAEWDAIASYRFDAVWLMGIWQRSPMASLIAKADPAVRAACRSVLPGFRSDDMVASPYAVHSYVAEERLGGHAGLLAARAQLAKRQLKLILDFVPNHTAPDHVWTFLHPEYYVRGSTLELTTEPERFYQADGDVVLAHGAVSRHGRPIWSDTAQLDPTHPGYRDAAVLTLLDIASQCDGVRCDMAMLVLNATFAANWSSRHVPKCEFWELLIAEVRQRYPNFLFVAESYSDSEWALQRLGFDYCYDKDRLYERLAHGDAESVRQHLQMSSTEFLSGLVHFLENHDEVPAGEKFRPAGRHQVAAVAIATLPGASLWYEGQFEGRWGHLPVQLGRTMSTRRFYQRLLEVTDHPAIREGRWAWCRVDPVNSLLAWAWSGERRLLVVLNLSNEEAWGRVRLDWQELRRRSFELFEAFSEVHFGSRDGSDALDQGLLVGLSGWGFQLFEIREGQRETGSDTILTNLHR